MDVIIAFIRWKRAWKAQASVARAKQVLVDLLVIIDDRLGSRRLGIRDAQEPSRAIFADPSEGCIIKMYFWRGTADVAEPIYRIWYDLLLYYKRFNRPSEGEERLVGEQGKDRENYAHLSKSSWRVIGPYRKTCRSFIRR
jgi:hypothetical protein